MRSSTATGDNEAAVSRVAPTRVRADGGNDVEATDVPVAAAGDVGGGDVALAAIWPGEPPADQLALWATMTQPHRDMAARRLRAVTSYERAGSRNAADFAEGGGFSVPRFHAVLRAWRKDRSLLALVPQAGGRAARAFEVPDGLEAAATAMVRAARTADGADADEADVATSRERVAGLLHERFGRPSLSWMRRLVARSTRDLERELAGGPAGFLRVLVVDSAALPLPLLKERLEDGRTTGAAGDGEEDVDWTVGAFAWDAATGRILGHALGRDHADMRLHAAAAADAAGRLRSLEAATAGNAAPRIVTTLPIQGLATLEAFRLARDLRDRGAEAIQGARAAGGELMRSFAGVIGGLELRPRFAADTFVGRISRAEALRRSGRYPMDVADARLALDLAVSRQNEEEVVLAGAPAVSPPFAADRLLEVFGPYLGG